MPNNLNTQVTFNGTSYNLFTDGGMSVNVPEAPNVYEKVWDHCSSVSGTYNTFTAPTFNDVHYGVRLKDISIEFDVAREVIILRHGTDVYEAPLKELFLNQLFRVEEGPL